MKTVKAKRGSKTEKAIQLKDGTLVFDKYRDVEDILYNAYSEKFQTGATTDNTWLAKFVNENLDKIKKGITMDPTTAPTALREVNKIATKTAEYVRSKQTFDTDLSRYLLQKQLFPWQKKVFEDTSKKKSLLAGRRSGKSFLINYLAISHCLEKSAKQRQAAIVGLTLERTASIYWDSLKEAVAKCHIEHKIDNAKYRITFSNGNFIELFGNGSKAEREKFRGFDLSFAAIDEMQSQQGLMYLIIDVIGPMLKGQDGDLVCAGTAPLSAGTYWEQIINDDVYTSFHATMEDNPTIPDHENALQTILEENHWTKDNITYRREYLGEVAYDTNRMIYPKRTYYKELPKEQFVACYIGIDYGWADYSSFAPILITNNKTGYLINEWKENKTASSAIVNKMKALVESIHSTYNIPNENIKLVADSSHQQISFDIYNQGVINIENAYKLGENYQIARVAEALEIGNLLIKEGDYFDQECNSMVWKWNDENGTVIYEIDDKTFHPDIADSVKYAWNTYLSENLY